MSARNLTLLLASGLGAFVPLASATAQTIGVSMVPPVAFFELLRDNMRNMEKINPGLTIKFSYAENGAGERQILQVKDYISSKVDAIIVLPVDAASTTTITSMAQAANIPLIYVNNGPREDWFAGRVALTIPNDLVAGRLQMTKMAQLMNSRGRVAIIGGPAGHSASQLRTQGVKDVVSEHPGITIVAEASADWDRARAEKIVTDWLASGKKFDAILANNDEMAIGAANAIEAAKLPRDQILIAGVDATPDGLKAVLTNRVAITVLQDPKIEGHQAVSDALRFVRGQPVEQYHWVDFDLISQINIRRFAN